MDTLAATREEIVSRLDELSPDDLPKILEYVEFLVFKREKSEQDEKLLAEQKTPYKVVVKLGGLWAGHEITDEEIAAARKEMWAGFGDIEL